MKADTPLYKQCSSQTGPGGIGVPQMEQRRSTAQISVRATPVMAKVGAPAGSRGVMAGIG